MTKSFGSEHTVHNGMQIAHHLINYLCYYKDSLVNETQLPCKDCFHSSVSPDKGKN